MVSDSAFDNPPRPRRPIPMVPIAAALCAGIILGRYLPLHPGVWAAICAPALLTAAVSAWRGRRRELTWIALLLAVTSAGAIHLRLTMFALPDNHLVTYTGDERICATVRGTVATFPVIAPSSASGQMGYDAPPWTSFVLQAESVLAGDHWLDVRGLARVTIYEPRRDLSAGQTVELVGWMGRFRPPSNPGQFDVRAYNRLHHTLVNVRVPVADGVRVINSRSDGPITRGLISLRAAARQHLAGTGEMLQGHLLNALIVGDRHPALTRLNETLRRAGLAHFLSISGLHLGIFLGFVLLSCRLLGRTPRQAAAIALVVLIAYVAMAQPRPPLLRSAIMAGVLCSAVLTGRPYSAINALAVAAVALLVWDPLQLMDAGFQLSFLIVAGLILLHRPVRQLLGRPFARRQGLSPERPTGLRRVLRRAGGILLDTAAVAISAYLVALPLVAVHFGILSPWGALLSVLILPLVVAVLVPGYLSLALAWPMPNLSWQIGRLAAGAADLLTAVVDAASHLPRLSIPLRPVGALWALSAYVTLGLVVHRPRGRRRWVLPVASASVLVLLTVASQRQAPPPPVAQLHLLDVGAGQCAVLRLPSGATWLIDAGSLHVPDVHGRVIAPFLRELRLPAPTGAVISHGNVDHFNALPSLLNHHRLDRVAMNEAFGRTERSTAAERDLLDQLREQDTQPLRLAAGGGLALDDRTQLEILWPPSPMPRGMTVNDTSLVVRLTCDGVSILLPGDLDSTGQAALLRDPQKLKCTVLVLPHHGGWETTLPELVTAADPDIILVSAGRLPAGSDDRSRAFYRLLFRGHNLFSTSRHGWIGLTFGQGTLEVETGR